MTIHRRTALAFALTAGSLPLAQAQPAADASGWPDRPIRLIVPFPPGGIDAAARIVCERLERRLGQPIVVDNRPGASGAIGMRVLAQAKADGYTMGVGSMTTHVTGPLVNGAPGYDPVQDFKPAGLFSKVAYVLAVPATSRFTSIEQLVAELKKKPDSLAYATAGPGTPQDLSATLFQQKTGTSMRAIAYKGGASAMPDLLSGIIDLAFDLEPSVGPLVKAGRLRALGVTSLQGLATLPGVPAIGSAPVDGLKGFEVTSWGGLFFPAGTPERVVLKVAAELPPVLSDAELQQKLRTGGFEAAYAPPEQLAALIRSDKEKWTSVFTQAGCLRDGKYKC